MKSVFLVCAVIAASLAVAAPQEPEALRLDQMLKKARVDGKYRMLLKMVRSPEALKEYGVFDDFGPSTATEVAGQSGLPKGFWVYVYPYWYIWRDRPMGVEQKRPWGPEQACGLPDTPEAGDINTAWASATPDGADEWLMLEYKTPVTATAVHIYETYNPGAVVKITAFTLDDREVEVWKRPRAVIPDAPAQIFRPGLRTRVVTNRIKLYLDSKSVPGWNEIDAVGLKDVDGGLQWAIAAHASSIYGVGGDAPASESGDLQHLSLEDKALAPCAAQQPAAEAPVQRDDGARKGYDGAPNGVVWGPGRELQAGVALVQRYGRSDQHTGLYVFGIYIRNVSKRPLNVTCPAFDGISVPHDRVDYTALLQSPLTFCEPRIADMSGKSVPMRFKPGLEKLHFALKPGQSAMISRWMLRTLPPSAKRPDTSDYTQVAFIDRGRYRVSCAVAASWDSKQTTRGPLRTGDLSFVVTAGDLKGQ